MRPSAVVAEAYASGKTKSFEFLIDAAQIPMILQRNYGWEYILQKNELCIPILYIPIWRDLYSGFTTILCITTSEMMLFTL